MFEGVCVGELHAIIKKKGQIVSVKVEAHHLKLLCIDSERLSPCTRSTSVQHGLHVVRVVGRERKVICKQQMGHQKSWSTSKRAYHPVYTDFNVIQVDGEQQRGEGTSSFNTKKWLHRSCLISIQQRIFIVMDIRLTSLLEWTGYCQAFGNYANGPIACFLQDLHPRPGDVGFRDE